MKKIIYLFAVASLLASCGEGNDYSDYAQPQANGPETEKNVTFNATAASAIDFNKVTSDSVQLFVPTVTSTSDPVLSQVLFATLYNTDKSQSVNLKADKNGLVKSSELQSAVKTLYGLSGDIHDVPAAVTDTIKVKGGFGFVGTAEIKSTINLVAPNFGLYLYEVGNEVNWDQAKEHTLAGLAGDGKYLGYCYLNGEFKFKPNKDNWDNDLECNGEGKIADINGGKNIPDPGAGFYQIHVDLGAGTYNLNKVNSISAVGDFSNWNAKSTDYDFTYNLADSTWDGTITFASDAQVKFCMNHDWSTAWGGTWNNGRVSDLTENNGANIKVPAGTYDIKITISYEGANKAVFTKR
jgi:hypothetical protein